MSPRSVYASDPNARSDDDFELGALAHLVPGAAGRLRDPRRTPVSVAAISTATGFAHIRIEGFEDAGAVWEVPLEHVDDFQFERGGPRAADAEVAAMEAAIERFAHERIIEADTGARARTDRRIDRLHAQATRWLTRHSRFLAAGRPLPDPSLRRGDPALAGDLEAWTDERGVLDLEQAFTRGFVSNPGSGEIVKGHRIVLAELGLTGYAGSIVRDPATFEGTWKRERRSEHIVSRLAFIRALFERLGIREVTLWRGVSARNGLRPRAGHSFVSTSLDEAVARSHYQSEPAAATHALVRQDVPVEHLFMTYHETRAMNTIFLEAEAIVLSRPHDGWP